ncbi:MAG TPA: DUF1129 family protein [Niallia sp.]|nr:DUF1129 family protein [Niallia sp.]
MKLSKEAESFLENLHLYLLTSGKNDQEIKEVVEELEDHLREAERKGKDIHVITGSSPKEYMESLANEMNTDIKEWAKLLPHVFISIIAYSLIGRIVLGEDKLSLWVLIGSVLITAIMLVAYVFVFRIAAKNNYTNKKMVIFLIGIQVISTLLFMMVLFFGNDLAPTFIIKGFLIKLILFCIPFFYLAWFAWWSKSMTVFIPLIIYIPYFIVNLFPVSEESKAIYTSIGLCLIMLFYIGGTIWNIKKYKKSA